MEMAVIVTSTGFPALPALRCLGDLADVKPKIVIDTREQAPLPFQELESETASLQTGDYTFKGAEALFAIERKSVADMVSCCAGNNRDRFFRELHRLRGFRFKRLLVVGSLAEIESGAYRSSISPAAVLGTLAALETRFDVPVVFCPTPEAAGQRIESWAYWFARDLVESANSLARAHGLTRRASGGIYQESRPKD